MMAATLAKRSVTVLISSLVMRAEWPRGSQGLRRPRPRRRLLAWCLRRAWPNHRGRVSPTGV